MVRRSWPADGKRLSIVLRRLAEALRVAGVAIELGRRGHGGRRLIRIGRSTLCDQAHDGVAMVRVQPSEEPIGAEDAHGIVTEGITASPVDRTPSRTGGSRRSPRADMDDGDDGFVIFEDCGDDD